nr:PREDICTED: N-alpha-acetyltransferase 35, NatC auxiliary subunit [Bemisia tabaci]
MGDIVTVEYTKDDNSEKKANMGPRLPRMGDAEDITEEFFSAVKELSLGELFHDEFFGLFEAMSAIEMMDPKMDAGMLCNRSRVPALSADELKMEGLTEAEQIGIIDATLACLVSWLEGHSLAQTVFTNLYMSKPHSIHDRPLRAFCIVVYNIIELLKDFVEGALVVEEEDFQPMTYGYNLYPEVPHARTIGLLKEVEDELTKSLRTSAVSSNKERHDDVVALHARIRLLRIFYQALLSLNWREADKEANIGEFQKLLNSCIEIIPTLQETVTRGLQPVQVENSDEFVMMGFDPLVNQRLLPPTFPRYTKIKSRPEAFVYLQELFGRLKQVCKVVNIASFHRVLDLFVSISRSNACIVSRSIMQILYLRQGSKNRDRDLTEKLREAARSFISPPALLPRSTILNNPQSKEYVDHFIGNCALTFKGLIHLYGHNRARQRDRLAGIMDEFANLQDEAERVDAFLNSITMKGDPPRTHLACFGTWMLYHTLKIMIMFLLSGFELELYSVHEYTYVFWYLYEFLYGWVISSLTRADNYLAEQQLLSSKSTRRKPAKKQKPRPFVREITYNQAMQNMCGGYYKAVLGLKLDGKIRVPRTEFDCERVRYEHRFFPFGMLVTPPPVQYYEFQEMTSLLEQSSSEMLYAAAYEHFHRAKTLFEGIVNPDQEVRNLLKIAKTNYVVLKLFATGHKRDSDVPLDFNFTVHQCFPIIKLN